MNSFAWLLRPIGRATLALCLPLLLAMAVPAAAQETPVPVLGIVNQGNACPTTSTLGAPTLPVFRQGDIVSICFGQNLAPSSSIQVKVGDKIAQVGQQSANGVLVGLPDQPNASTYVVSGTVNSTQFTPFLIQFYPTSKALVTGVSPATTIRGKPVRINGQGLAAPKSAIEVWFGDEKAQLDDVAADGSWVLATLAPNTAVTSGGPRPVEVRVWNLPADQPQGPVSATLLQAVGFNETLKIIGVALAPVVLVAAFVAWLFWSQQRRARNWLRGLIAALLFDDSTQTYSLSKAQFYWWLAIIAFAYAFLFVARGITAGKWEFPPFNGLIGTLGISTLTVLGAIVASGVRGQKGSGAIHPAPSDLIMHGGVIAPERVQQVLWTVLAGAAVLWIVITTYATETTLPDIPQELLLLMGLSSAAYIGGKLVRSPGPIIRQVDTDPNSKPTAVELLVSGDNLERDATVVLDRAVMPRSAITVEPAAATAGQPPVRGVSGQDIAETNQQFVSKLRLITSISMASWDSSAHELVIVNSDGQRSEWRTEPVMTPAEADSSRDKPKVEEPAKIESQPPTPTPAPAPAAPQQFQPVPAPDGSKVAPGAVRAEAVVSPSPVPAAPGTQPAAAETMQLENHTAERGEANGEELTS